MDFSCEHRLSSHQVTLPFDCVTYLALFVVDVFVILRHPCIYVLIISDQKEFHCNSDTSTELPHIQFSNVSILMLQVLRTFCCSWYTLVPCINIENKLNRTTSNVFHGHRT